MVTSFLRAALSLSACLCLLPIESLALKCGIKGVTMPCIGDTDVRYNPNISYDLKEQNDFWKAIEGMYVLDLCDYDADGLPQRKGYLAGLGEEEGFGSFDFCNTKAFMNMTVDGSRFYMHRYQVSKFNNDGTNSLVLPGLVIQIDGYATSTFEKNGEVYQLGDQVGISTEEGAVFAINDNPAKMTPVSDRSLLGTGEAGGLQTYESQYCVDLNCNQFNIYNEGYVLPDDSSDPYIARFTRMNGKKVDKVTWMKEFDQTLIDFNVPALESAVGPFAANPWFVKPFDPSMEVKHPKCITAICPTEDDWRVRDPVYGLSPYTEPDGVLTGGFIAGVTIASIVVAAGIFYFIYKRGVEARERRIKESVLESISQTMSITTQKELTPIDLGNMFKKIDVDGNGNLSKDEMKEMVNNAGIANMNDRDYNILFNAIDLDHNGTLDFVEFCAFFASIPVSGTGKGSNQEHDSSAEA